MSKKSILSVGQCGFDHGNLERTLARPLDAELVAAHSAAEALRLLDAQRFSLVLVNRVFDADGDSGLALIETIKKTHQQVPAMLVSNYDDAQQEAIALGALPGFGKSALASPTTLARVRSALIGEPNCVSGPVIRSLDK